MTVDVLLVEDNPGDARLTRETFHGVNKAVHLHLTTDGVEAMAFLRQEGQFADAPRPALIILDLNLPKVDGREVLQRVKSDPSLMTIPVAILTTSDAETDIARSYQLNANCYLTKPVKLEDFENLVRSLNDFWFTNAKLMTGPGASLH